MINVNCSVARGSAALYLKGHALYAPRGQDIVCAAVSSLCIALAGALSEEKKINENGFTFISASDDGELLLKAEKFSDNGTALRILSWFTLVLNGLASLEKLYPRCISVKKDIIPLRINNIDTSEQTMNLREKGSSMREISLLQHFSENSSEGENSEAAENFVTPENGSTLTDEEEFETLIGGRYKEAFRKRTQGIIDRRFAKMKGFENTARVCAPLLERLSQSYPHIDKSDTEALVTAFLEEKEKTEAENEKKDAFNAISEKIEEALAHRSAERLSQVLRDEAQKLREIYPSFELHREISSSPELRQLLSCGVSLRRAYETVNLEKILAASMKYAAVRAGKTAADSVRSTRVQENSLTGNAASVSRTDVRNLTEKDILRIISEVNRGAKISFK